MFGLDFLFLFALIALPLVGLPVVLHLLHRSKSTIVLFSTTRFIQASIQQTAARKKLQKWLLLTIRMLLILLLILMAAQPVKRLASSLGGESAIAAIVVDTSYSMQTQSTDNQSLSQRTDMIVSSLLRNELAGAKVAVYRSQNDTSTETLQSASDQQNRWQAGKTEVAKKPLVDRIEQARKMLENQQAASKWLIVLTDSQAKEFPRVLDPWNEGHTVWFDLHPDSPRSSGITQLSIDPYPPLPGISEEAVIKVAGNNDQSRAVTLNISTIDGKVLAATSPRMVGAAEKGESEIRIPFTMPAEPFVRLTAKIGGDDDLNIDNARELIIQSLSRQNVRFLNPSGLAGRFISLAIDPTEGKSKDWPLMLKPGAVVQSDDHVLVSIWLDWPTTEQASALRQSVEQGKKLILFLRPGIETRWNGLGDSQKESIQKLLPGTPMKLSKSARTYQAAATSDSAAFLKELADARYQVGSISIERFVPLEKKASATELLSINSAHGNLNQGLFYRQSIGNGTVFTMTTLPDPQFSTLASHPLFLPMIVKACLPDRTESTAQNVTVGETLKLAAGRTDKLNIFTPTNELFAIDKKSAAGQYEFARTAQPGIYTWKTQSGQLIKADSVQLPSDESTLNYRAPNTIISGDQLTIIRDLDEFHTHITSITQPQPKWSPVIALMLVLMCLETLFGNHSGLWKLIGR